MTKNNLQQFSQNPYFSFIKKLISKFIRSSKKMNFQGKKSSFNFYKKQEILEQHNDNLPKELQRQSYLLSENSNNLQSQHLRNNSSASEVNHLDIKNYHQEYYCLTCNAKYDGIIKCRHSNNQQEDQFQNSGNQQSKIYTCSYQKCQKKFNLESGLTRHRVVHTGQKPYSCDYQNCSQTFNQKSNLNRHKKIHKNQKPFICSQCCKSFTTTTNLKQHSQVHIQKKQQRKHYTCEMTGCNKKYLYRCNLKKHKLQHQDPAAGLMVESSLQRSVKMAKFQIDLINCKIILSIRDSSIQDHSEMKITYDENLFPNAQIYNPVFMLSNDEMNRQQMIDKKIQQEKFNQMFIKNLQEFFIGKPSEISASFYIHPDLIDYGKIVIHQVITLLEEKGTKEIRFFVENKQSFSKCVLALTQIFF